MPITVNRLRWGTWQMPCRYPPFYLSKLLNNSLFKTFTELVSERRVEASKELLKSGKRIKEIAYEVGFQGQNYFTKIFKKYTGVTPKMYKNSFDDK
ncbi:helix-turn-helix domain-containing protein [Thomasclavelia ramosa]|uniref:helix-turn-helix domain-containing protein n=1 Tax=Thomasclavelia ramosa TaxID=1547 RepID=UPI0027D30710|nr:AraC family transcriptional regulator [Thomasclavelia ramosa]